VISRTTKSFWKLYDRLPEEVRRGAANAYAQWAADPDRPALQFNCVNERIGLHWRAMSA
jgi:hypothetical protein